MRTPFTTKWLLALFLLIVTASAPAQSILDQYLATGLKENLVLTQKNVALDRALLSLKIASGMFAPSVNFQGSYTSGDGGRAISLPIGDLLNNVYTTLNQLTDSQQFPQVENVNQNFFPNNMYDVRLRTTVPIVNSDLIYNRRIQQQQVVLKEYEVEIYRRELVRDIKRGYFMYLTAQEAVNIYETALARAREGKRVNESLLANGKGLPAYLLRSESEIENINTQITEARKQVHNAKLYFNFLLNRPSEAEIVSDYSEKDAVALTPVLLSQKGSVQNREELMLLKTYSALQENVVKMNQLYWSPRINGFLDLGSQQENWQFNDQSRYYLFGLQLDMPLFAGSVNKNKIRQARLDVQNTSYSYELTRQQLEMSAQVALNAVESSYQGYQSSMKQLEAAASYQRLIEKGYKEGVNTFIEAVDARNQLTAAQLQVTINQYRVLIATANYERETASYTLNK